MRKLLVVVALLFVPHLHAQLVEVYGTFTDLHATNVPSSVVAETSCPVNVLPCPAVFSTRTSSDRGSVAGGVTFNFLRLPVVKIGIDLRGSRHFGMNGADTALAGVKLTIHPPLLNIRPYLQGSAGYLGTTATERGSSAISHPTTTAKYAAAEVLAGLDLPIMRILDLRLIEIGGGHALNSQDNTKPTFVTASAGLVLHF